MARTHALARAHIWAD